MRIHGRSYTVAGRRLIIRVDDPGVAPHELAHCKRLEASGTPATCRAPDPAAKANYQVRQLGCNQPRVGRLITIVGRYD
jgi:hypothetical protein